ncbi:hypothetical protein M2475_001353 [Breznakia sp. PF5-3]|uniref:hypothetical protein n=1 Tax=unclassified Breznakia TaxID=2623764 RepID=UPI002406DEC5|nr:MULTISPECIES: hypothetical protein [unclassified Breznakia]MDF9824953.1 hypothetical protein [Breznakia sp. PM6-1]MDF9835779.1 hypothetical protein [Breznakia sp. PF5-3]MDF9837927.1 hypothetical protein [Breznakia sp. PFB2-8]MDF9859916.1 hypothetical protein [Breznakia sp. PH5-24]
MKKIFIIALVAFSCIACSSDSDPVDPGVSNVELYDEVAAYEAKMKTLDSYKIRKTEDVEVPVCGAEEISVKKENTNPREYQVIKDGDDIAYFWKQKQEQEIQYRIIYYKNGSFYEEFTQMSGSVNLLPDWSKEQNDTLIMDKVFHEIDTTYFTVDVKEEEGNKVYTFTLKDADGYNKKYNTDRDSTCGIKGDYVGQKFELKVNKDGYIVEETVEETVKYKYNDQVHERLNTVKYEFYDLNVPNEINFYFL